ncbi:MAG: SMC-Scp complex subunit ScpB, partial [Polyangiaceae bacterium]|nr:SMC-Scp complex subunit ScpB [Polyangiaceae bacterium]
MTEETTELENTNVTSKAKRGRKKSPAAEVASTEVSLAVEASNDVEVSGERLEAETSEGLVGEEVLAATGGDVSDAGSQAELDGEETHVDLSAEVASLEEVLAGVESDEGDKGEGSEEDSLEASDLDAADLDAGDLDAAAGISSIENTTDVSRKHLKCLLESLIFASDKPMTSAQLSRSASSLLKDVKPLLQELQEEYSTRGIQLDEIAGGWLFRTRAEFAPFVRDMAAKKPVRLSRAQVETLAILAYRQPVTRPEVDEIRGVDSGAVLKLLLDRDLIRIMGKKEEAGRPLLYGTTPAFLEFFGLKSLRELPTLQEFTELSEDSRRVAEQELGEVLDEAQIRAAAFGAEETPGEPGAIAESLGAYGITEDSTLGDLEATEALATESSDEVSAAGKPAKDEEEDEDEDDDDDLDDDEDEDDDDLDDDEDEDDDDDHDDDEDEDDDDDLDDDEDEDEDEDDD